MCKTDSEWDAAVWHRELSSVPGEDPEGWMGVGEEAGSRGRGFMYTDS